MTVIGLDPGYKQTAIVVWDGAAILEHFIWPNDVLLDWLDTGPAYVQATLVVEQIQVFSSNYGVGQEVFDSVFWSGRFVQAWHPGRFDRMLRSKVRGHLGASKGGDAAVRQSLIQRFGPYKEVAIGTKHKPGPLYGIKADEWSALAIAVVWSDVHGTEVRPGLQPEF